MGLEKTVDDIIGRLIGLFRANKLVVVALVAAVAAFFWSSLRALVSSQTSALSSVLSSGLSSEQFASGLAIGVASGLGPPGMTLFLGLPLAARLHSALVASPDAPSLALAAAVNALFTVPDLLVWNAVFSRIGSLLLPGGRYVRPFVAGTAPWLASVPLILLGVRAASKIVF